MLLLSLRKKATMKCSHCSGEHTKKNGHTHYGKQNYYCHNCQIQFVEGGQAWFVSDSDKLLINKLLLERISLSGICRVCDVSQTWLLAYIKELYDNLPDELNADLSLPDMESYLADRMEEEIGKIEAIKKIRLYYRSTFS
jgi:transposase-like protein